MSHNDIFGIAIGGTKIGWVFRPHDGPYEHGVVHLEGTQGWGWSFVRSAHDAAQCVIRGVTNRVVLGYVCRDIRPSRQTLHDHQQRILGVFIAAFLQTFPDAFLVEPQYYELYDAAALRTDAMALLDAPSDPVVECALGAYFAAASRFGRAGDRPSRRAG